MRILVISTFCNVRYEFPQSRPSERSRSRSRSRSRILALDLMRESRCGFLDLIFLGKFISEEFWPFDLGVTSWHWFPDCQLFLGRSYPSGCIGHRPLVSSALRSYGDRCMPRVPSNPAACFPPSISISWLNYYVLAFGFIFGHFLS